MKPNELSVSRIEHKQARAFVEQHHYARGAANTSVLACGLFRADRLLGAALFMPPIVTVARYVGSKYGCDPRTVVTLSRFVLHPETQMTDQPHKWVASWFLSRAVKLLDLEKWRVLVTYADERLGHKGTIYKACNFTHDGVVRGHPVWLDSSGRMVSAKSTKNVRFDEMRARGLTQIEGGRKHRFVFVLPTSHQPRARH